MDNQTIKQQLQNLANRRNLHLIETVNDHNEQVIDLYWERQTEDLRVVFRHDSYMAVHASGVCWLEASPGEVMRAFKAAAPDMRGRG